MKMPQTRRSFVRAYLTPEVQICRIAVERSFASGYAPESEGAPEGYDIDNFEW